VVERDAFRHRLEHDRFPGLGGDTMTRADRSPGGRSDHDALDLRRTRARRLGVSRRRGAMGARHELGEVGTLTEAAAGPPLTLRTRPLSSVTRSRAAVPGGVRRDHPCGQNSCWRRAVRRRRWRWGRTSR